MRIVELYNLFKIGATLDTFLLVDIYGNLRSGQSFERAIHHHDDSPITHSKWRFDEEKLTIVYAQMQRIASKNKNHKIVFDFYDDRKD